MHYLIYKITNRLNNKIYIGKHKTDDKNDSYLGSGILIKKAVEKYGRESFTKELLVECATEEEMNKMEEKIVDDEFVSRQDTYNVMVGGQGGGGKSQWDVAREKLSILRKNPEFAKAHNLAMRIGADSYYLNNPGTFLGKCHSDITRQKMSKAKLGLYDGEKNPMFGKMWITDGVTSTRINKSDTIPVGYKKGRLVKKSS